MKFFYNLIILMSILVIQSFSEDRYLEDHYDKAEYQIPMRDGVRLFTAVYSPKDKLMSYPILIWRTPYSCQPYGKDYVTRRRETWGHLAKEGYIIVFQDVRGRFMSEGTYDNMRPYISGKTGKQTDETTDTYDTVDWLVKNVKGNNGNVGLWGISYPGFYAAMAAIDSHPAVKAVSPQAPIANWFGGDDWHHNGAFAFGGGMSFMYVFGQPRDGLVKEWPKGFSYPTGDGFQFHLDLGPLKNVNELYFKNGIPFWNDLMQHGQYDDFWKSRNILPHLNSIKPATLVVGGWFDAENLFGALQIYQSIEKKNPANRNFLVMGPWSHGGWVRTDGSSLGDIGFKSETGTYYVEKIELPFFNYYLKGKGNLNLPEASVFETGSNTWKKYDAWPPASLKSEKLFFEKNFSLSFQSPENAEGFDSYTSNPAKPVPFTAEITTDVPKPYMIEDQRFASRRTDVLTYQTEVLQDPITCVGSVEVELFITTTGSDLDLVVKLVDVLPKDSPSENNIVYSEYQMLVRADIFRCKFRNGLSNPEPIQPGQVTPVKFSLNDLNHSFLPGHKLMVQVQSSWFPLFDRNPQKFVDIYNCSADDFQEAEVKLNRSSQYPSSLKLNIL